MPARQTPPAGKPRGRAGPTMPGSWIWLIILGAVLIMLLVNYTSDRKKVDYSDFQRIIDNHAKNLSKIVMVGTEKIVVEVKNPDDLPDDVKDKLKGAKEFWLRGQGQEVTKELNAKLDKLIKENPDLKVSWEEE